MSERQSSDWGLNLCSQLRWVLGMAAPSRKASFRGLWQLSYGFSSVVYGLCSVLYGSIADVCSMVLYVCCSGLCSTVICMLSMALHMLCSCMWLPYVLSWCTVCIAAHYTSYTLNPSLVPFMKEHLTGNCTWHKFRTPVCFAYEFVWAANFAWGSRNIMEGLVVQLVS